MSADADSFRSLGVEVSFVVEEIGEVWLVPAYTTQPRIEIGPEVMDAIDAVRAVFPMAKLARIAKKF